MKYLLCIFCAIPLLSVFFTTTSANAQDIELRRSELGNLPGKENILATRIEKVDELQCGFILNSIVIEQRGFTVEISENGQSHFLYLVPDENGNLSAHPDSWQPCQAALNEIIRLISPAEAPWQWDILPDISQVAQTPDDPCKNAAWISFSATKNWPEGWEPQKASCSNDEVDLKFIGGNKETFEIRLKKTNRSPWIRIGQFSLSAPPVQLKSHKDFIELKTALENLTVFSESEETAGNKIKGSMPFSTPSDWLGTLTDGINYRYSGVHPGIVMPALLLFLAIISTIAIRHLPKDRRILTGGAALLLLALGIRAAFGIFAPSNFRSDIFAGDMQQPFFFGTAYPTLQALLFYIFGRSLQVVYWSNVVVNSLTTLLAVWWLLSMKVKESVAWTAGVLMAIAPAYVWVGSSDAHQNMVAFMLLWLLLANVHACKGRTSILWLALIPISTWLIVIWRTEAIIFPALSTVTAIVAGLHNKKGKPYLRWVYIISSTAAISVWGILKDSEYVSSGISGMNISTVALLWPRYGWIAAGAGLPLSIATMLGIFNAFRRNKIQAFLFVLLCAGVLLPFSSMILSPISQQDRVIYRYFVPALPFFMFFAAYGIDALAEIIDRLTTRFLPSPGKNTVSALLAGTLLILSVPDYRYDLTFQQEMNAVEKAIPELDSACPLYFIKVDCVFGALAPPYFLPWFNGSDITIKSDLPQDNNSCLYFWKPPLCDLPESSQTSKEQKIEQVAPAWELCNIWRNIPGLKLLQEFDMTGAVYGFADGDRQLKAGLYFREGDRKYE